jgi:hypothetical protein
VFERESAIRNPLSISSMEESDTILFDDGLRLSLLSNSSFNTAYAVSRTDQNPPIIADAADAAPRRGAYVVVVWWAWDDNPSNMPKKSPCV